MAILEVISSTRMEDSDSKSVVVLRVVEAMAFSVEREDCRKESFSRIE